MQSVHVVMMMINAMALLHTIAQVILGDGSQHTTTSMLVEHVNVAMMLSNPMALLFTITQLTWVDGDQNHDHKSLVPLQLSRQPASIGSRGPTRAITAAIIKPSGIRAKGLLRNSLSNPAAAWEHVRVQARGHRLV